MGLRPTHARTTTSALVVYGLVGGVAVALFMALPSPGLSRDILFSAVSALGFAGVVAGVRIHRPVPRVPWILIAAGVGFWLAASLVWLAEAALGDDGSGVSPADLFFAVMYVLFSAGLMLLLRARGTGSNDATPYLDAAMITLGMASLVWAIFLAPHASDPLAGIVETVVRAYYPIADTILLGILALFGLTYGERGTSFRLMIAAVALLVVPDFAWTAARLSGRFPDDDLLFVPWMLFLISWGAAALHPSMRDLGRTQARTPSTAISRRMRRTVTATASLVPLGVVAVQVARGATWEIYPTLGLAAVTVLLGGVRVGALSREVVQERATSQALEDALSLQTAHAKALSEANEMKDAFLSAVSHELRTPLTNVLGYVDTMRRADERLSPEQRADFLERLVANAQRLDRLLGDLLDVDRLARGTVRPVGEPTRLDHVVERVVAVAGAVDGRRLSVSVEPVEAWVQAGHVERIVENLLSNAVRYTEDDVPIWVSVTRVEGGALLSVEDAGPGVPAHLREAIFDPFFQGPGRVEHSPGVGIGLSLVARLAQLAGGKVWVDPRPGGGACFRVQLPVAAPAKLPPGTDRSLDAASVVGSVLRTVQALTGLESVYLTRIDWAAEEQEIVQAYNTGTLRIRAGDRIAWTDTICRRALVEGPAFSSDVAVGMGDPPSAASLGIVTYAGFPVVGEDGGVAGTLCAADGRSRDLHLRARDLMQVLADLLTPFLASAGERRP
ncbi:MAG TPA: ATP-binding protein [Actinomycetota bacterium]|nr:ATP-binding protein [Actinomycetota bacterium]